MLMSLSTQLCLLIITQRLARHVSVIEDESHTSSQRVHFAKSHVFLFINGEDFATEGEYVFAG